MFLLTIIINFILKLIILQNKNLLINRGMAGNPVHHLYNKETMYVRLHSRCELHSLHSVCYKEETLLNLSLRQIAEFRKLLMEEQFYRIDRPITVLCNNDFSDILILCLRVIIIFAVQKRHNISVLFKRA